MGARSRRQQELLKELFEWWEDIRETGIGSRVVLVEVPAGWGTTTVLEDFATTVADPDAPVAITVVTGEVPREGRAVEAKALSDALLTPLHRSRLAHLFGLDTPGGKTDLALGVGGLFVSGMAVQVSLLLASLGATAVLNAWDAGTAGQQGMLARAARALATASAEVPVVALMDDADRFDPDLAALMIESLASRLDGQVLVVAAVRPGSLLAEALRGPGQYGLLGRVVVAEADPNMSAADRTALARELRPGLPDSAAERIGQRTASFADVFAIVDQDRLADVTAGKVPSAVPVVDAVIDAALARPAPSVQARVLAWAGGALTIGQADQALLVLGEYADQVGDLDVIRVGRLARLKDPASSHVRAQAELLSASARRSLAAAVLQEATRITGDSGATLIEQTVARLAAHRIRADLDPSAELSNVQCLLMRGLEQLGDPEAAYQIAVEVFAELPRNTQVAQQRADLLQLRLRLACTRPPQLGDPLVQEAIGLATTSGALLGIEARVWAAVNLLRRPGPHEAALTLVDQLITDLSTYQEQDFAASQWRLLLAFHTGQAGYLAAAQNLLAPVISSGTSDQQNAAQAVLRALEDPRADIRLQITILEAELKAATPKTAEDDCLRMHHALAGDYHQLGGYREALHHGTAELRYRLRLQHPDHPSVLTARHNIAAWMGYCGDAEGALRLFRELLPDEVRVLGRDHPSVLTTRNNIAVFTGHSGNHREALRLFRELLPDEVRVLGRDHPSVLTTRNDIAAWTSAGGDYAAALRLFRELLPDEVRVLGRDHPSVLTTRNNIAACTGHCGDYRKAVRLTNDLMPDLARVLGRDHPQILATRNNIAEWTGAQGDYRGALELSRELLPDQTRVLGRDHPSVFTTRSNIALWTRRCGDARTAVRLSRELLSDRIRVLGRNHPDVLTTRHNIATGMAGYGNYKGALELFGELLPDQIRVLGRTHPGVLTTRNDIAACTGYCGNTEGAVRLFRELLPDQVRLLGRDHPYVLTTRNNIAYWTGRRGHLDGALRLFRELLPDQVRLLGRDHPYVLTTRNNIADLKAQLSSKR